VRYTEVLQARYTELVREKEMRDRGEDPRTVIYTGLSDFDEKSGIDRSILTVIGAPTGEGKSIFKKHVQEHAAMRGMRSLDLSFEDPPSASADRTFSTLTGINNAKLKKGADDGELTRVALALDEAAEWADNIQYEYGLKRVEQAWEIIQRAGDDGVDLVQIDYAQAFPAADDKTLERTIADFAWVVAEWAQDSKAAVIIYSQLKPEVERRGVDRAESSRRFSKEKDTGVDIDGFRPFGVSDLAWAAALGTYAKGLGFLFRPGRYRRRYKENVKDDRMELIWPKKNFGSEGTVVVGFDGRTARLFDLPKETK
jgi:hypothetical protein